MGHIGWKGISGILGERVIGYIGWMRWSEMLGKNDKKGLGCSGSGTTDLWHGSRHAHHYPMVAVAGSIISLKGLYLLVYKNIYFALFTSPWGMNSAIKIIHANLPSIFRMFIFGSCNLLPTWRRNHSWTQTRQNWPSTSSVPVKEVNIYKIYKTIFGSSWKHRRGGHKKFFGKEEPGSERKQMS